MSYYRALPKGHLTAGLELVLGRGPVKLEMLASYSASLFYRRLTDLFRSLQVYEELISVDINTFGNVGSQIEIPTEEEEWHNIPVEIIDYCLANTESVSK